MKDIRLIDIVSINTRDDRRSYDIVIVYDNPKRVNRTLFPHYTMRLVFDDVNDRNELYQLLRTFTP